MDAQAVGEAQRGASSHGGLDRGVNGGKMLVGGKQHDQVHAARRRCRFDHLEPRRRCFG